MAGVVVLGAGFGGLTAAYELRRLLSAAGRRTDEVTFVSRRPVAVYRPALPWVAFGWRRPSDITVDLARACRRRGIRFALAEVVLVDLDRREVVLDSGALPYDQLVLSLGGEPRDDVPGLASRAWSVIWPEEAVRLREAVRRFRGGPVVIGLLPGAFWPCAAYEVLHFFLEHARERGLARRTKVCFVTGEQAYMACAGRQVSRTRARSARAKGAVLRAGVRVAAVEDGAVILEGGETLESELTCLVPSLRAPAAIRSCRGLPRDDDGFVRVGPDLCVQEGPGAGHVWVVGDLVSRPGFKNGRMAEDQARVVAWNVAQRLGAAHSDSRVYRSSYVCITAEGRGRAVALYTRPAPGAGDPRPFRLTVAGRIPYAVKIGLEKTWLARHR
ncbi:MAG: FAD-dependent oxidoreductase [Actinomycetia bacterium]|nr:FAD-dependent oxidoreductase [Actinomycetes bacterium]